MSDSREFIYQKGTNQYQVRINPDIAARGGEKGRGCTFYVWQLNADGTVIPDLRADQGPYSQAALNRLIKSFTKYPLRGAK